MTAQPERVALRDALAAAHRALGPAAAVLDDEQREAITTLSSQLADLIDPATAPRRVVVTGPTGGGKSTLVNTISGAAVAATGVLRPTTRTPLVAAHPDDLVAGAWLPPAAQFATHAGIKPGVVLVDLPDIALGEAVSADASRGLLATADRLLFVTTAARYADAVPWQQLREARARGVALAVLVNRVPSVAVNEVRDHLAELLTGQGLARVPLLVVADETVTGGQLPTDALSGLTEWLAVSDAPTVDPDAAALAGMWLRLNGVADAVAERQAATKELEAGARAAGGLALTRLRAELAAGAVMRGEALARWRDFVAAGDLLRALESRAGHWTPFWGAWTHQAAIARCESVSRVVARSLAALVTATIGQALDDVGAAWRTHTRAEEAMAATAAVLDHDTARTRAATLVAAWQRYVREMVATEQVSRRTAASLSAFGKAATATVVAVAALAGEEPGELAGGDRAASVVVSDHVIRRLAAKARAELLSRCEALVATLDEQVAAALSEVLGLGDTELPAKIRAAAIMVEAARKGEPGSRPELTPAEVAG